MSIILVIPISRYFAYLLTISISYYIFAKTKKKNKYIMLYFDNDYLCGAHPLIMKRLNETNMESTVGYGLDPYCDSAKKKICDACDAPDAAVHFLVGGTQTNATVIDGLLARHEGVLAVDSSHVNVHESGAIEASGHKVLVLPSHDGKVDAKDVEKYINDFYGDETYEHMVAPGMVYISQPTEYGTLYSLSELEALHEVCNKYDIPLYADGARLGYALAAEDSDVTIKDMARLCDVFYIGGTKVGALFGEAVVNTRPDKLKHFFPLVKQHGALLAKGRLLGLQFDTLFTDSLYMNIGAHAVRLAIKLKKAFVAKGYETFIDSPTNQQFFRLPNEKIDELAPNVGFSVVGARGETHSIIRLVTSWSTSEEDVDALIALL